MTQMYGYFLVALCVIGTTGNLLTLVVLRHKSDRKKSTSWLLQVSAVVDSVYLLTRLSSVLFQFVACRQIPWLPLAVSRSFATAASFTESGASTVHMISVWTLVVVTVDRYITVCRPGEAQLRTMCRARVAVTCVTVASVACCLPLFVDWKSGGRLSPLDCDDVKLATADSKAAQGDCSWWFVSYQFMTGN